MNSATITALRDLHASTSAPERTMSAAEMALTSWGKVWAEVNVAPDGTRWAFDARRSLFVAYGTPAPEPEIGGIEEMLSGMGDVWTHPQG